VRIDQIKVGGAYTGKDEAEVRVVTEIGLRVRPGTGLTLGVEFLFLDGEQYYARRLYLDTFAQWARKEVL